MPSKSARHWNNNQMCAVAINTTGPDPMRHEVWEVSILPLDNTLDMRRRTNPLVKDSPTLLPFNIYIKPDNPERLHPKTKRWFSKHLKDKLRVGVSLIDSVSIFESWFQKLEMDTTKWGTAHKIIPLSHHYAYLYPFLVKWLGLDLYEEYFHKDYRDIGCSAAYLNENASAHGQNPFWHKLNLSWLVQKVETQHDPREYQDTLFRATKIALTYKKMVAHGLL